MKPADHAGRADHAGPADHADDAGRAPHEPGLSRRWWRGRLFQVTLSLLVVVLIFGFLFPKLANYGEVWKTVKDMTWLEVATLALFALWNLASYWPLLVAVQPGLRVREAAVANLASTAIAIFALRATSPTAGCWRNG